MTMPAPVNALNSYRSQRFAGPWPRAVGSRGEPSTTGFRKAAPTIRTIGGSQRVLVDSMSDTRARRRRLTIGQPWRSGLLDGPLSSASRSRRPWVP